jgi:hypothetical protein
MHQASGRQSQGAGRVSGFDDERQVPGVAAGTFTVEGEVDERQVPGVAAGTFSVEGEGA